MHEFNHYTVITNNLTFTNIGPNLAKEICVPSRNNFKNYLLNQNDNNLTFKLIGEDFVSKLIDDLDSKNSTGCDGLSNTLLKSIKLNLVKPITLIVNQMLTTGIFPDKLKIAKVIHYSKREINLYFRIAGPFLYYHQYPNFLKK